MMVGRGFAAGMISAAVFTTVFTAVFATVAAMPARLLAQDAPQSVPVIPNAANPNAASSNAASIARQLGDALQMDRTFAVMQREAVESAKEIAPDLFGGNVPAPWEEAVSRLFDPAASRVQFDAAFETALQDAGSADAAAALGFLQSPFGLRLLDLELSAREALLEPDLEDAAKKTWADLLKDPMPASTQRAALIGEIIAANDLIETNVSAALNGNLAFYMGLADSGFAADMTSEDMLREVWAQEADLRADMQDWLFPYLHLAYTPLSDAELQEYIAFSKSSAGKLLNHTLLAAFDTLSTAQSRQMGLMAGQLMAGQDI